MVPPRSPPRRSRGRALPPQRARQESGQPRRAPTLCARRRRRPHRCQAGPLNFNDMGDEQRKQWLDDGLHFTQHGYDQLAGHIANAISSNYVASRR